MSCQPDLFTDPDAELDEMALRLVRAEYREAVSADRRFKWSNRPGELRVPTGPAWKRVLDAIEEMTRRNGRTIATAADQTLWATLEGET